MTTLVLASASPARLETLQRAGIDPYVMVSDVDEDAAVAAAQESFGELGAEDIALLLANAKCQAITTRFVEGDVPENAPDDAVIVGCDSVLELDGEVLGKPADAVDAKRRWQHMRGKVGTLHTGHWIIDEREDGSGATVGSVASAQVHFADLSDDEIDAYIATGEPLWVAGAFTIDGLGGAYIERIEGDPHAVVGLSLPLLREILSHLGIAWHELWRSRQ